MFVSLSTQSSSAHVEETDQELLRAHSQTREHWGRECTFSYLGPVGFLKWSSKANRGGVALVTRMDDVYKRRGVCGTMVFLQIMQNFKIIIKFRQVLVLYETSKLQVL